MKAKQTQWARLDKAARIFPCTSTARDTKVFRFSCELLEPVHPEQLQMAAEKTLEAFPGWQTVLKRGLFWYYLEGSSFAPVVREEYQPPCAPMYDKEIRKLLFEVTYFGPRINLEVYHALSDGTGALQFFRTLLSYYLHFHTGGTAEELPPIDYDASEGQRMDDSFQKYAGQKSGVKPPKAVRAYRLKGNQTPDGRLSVIEGTLPLREALNRSRGCGVSLTVMLTAVLMAAVGEEMSVRDKKRPVVITVPINLRQYFPSESARNFFSLMDVRYDFTNWDGSLEPLMKSVGEQFLRELSEEELVYRVNQYMGLQRNPFARITPLPLKDLFMKIGYQVASRSETAAISNVGPVSLPGRYSPLIRMFDVFVSKQGLQLCLCSYEDTLTLTFTSSLTNTEVQKKFFRKLSAMGLPVTVAAVPFSKEDL